MTAYILTLNGQAYGDRFGEWSQFSSAKEEAEKRNKKARSEGKNTEWGVVRIQNPETHF